MQEPFTGGRVHVIGIGGIGMSAIAEVMAARRIPVQGSDQKWNANLDRLTARGIPVYAGHDASHLDGVASVVVSTAVQAGNPELDAARARNLPVFSRAQALSSLMRGYRTISVTGSHGKTTTTAMIAWMLEQGGLDPTALVGGLLRSWGSNARIGAGEWMVVEADESDGTFLALPSEIGVVTNIDPEHLDYWGSESALNAAFETFFHQILPDGIAIAGLDHPVVKKLLAKLLAAGKAPSFTGFGQSSDADVRISGIRSNGGSVRFDIEAKERASGSPVSRRGVELQIPGVYNALNAAAAVAAGLSAGLPPSTIFEALASFEGVDRRFTRAGAWNGVTIYDDYAHHPAEIEAALSAARGATEGRVIAIVQPHRYSRLKSLFDGFCRCFREADMVFVAPVYPAGEAPNGYDRDRLVEGIKLAGHARVYPLEGEDALAPAIAALARPGDLVIGLGAGSITEWARALPARLADGAVLAGAA